ncbi:hypothetical protein KKH23_08020 [Patescibacteria group bacterium]|nr:hypothetical protein [Patescibacteria group bacterium]MBU0847122.1 hypothetical protein [Patescibacteria group bacterium]
MSERRTAEEILEYCKQSTPGPWEWEAADASLLGLGTEGIALMEGSVLGITRCKACQERTVEEAPCMWPKREDAYFIVRARTDLPAVTKAAVELRRALNKVAGKLVWPEEPGWREGAIALLDGTTWLEPIEEV